MREVIERKSQEKTYHFPEAKRAKRLYESIPAGLWKGRRCFVVGGGTSLKGFDFSQLRGELVIAVNRAFEDIDTAPVMLAQDARLWGWYQDHTSPEYLGDAARKKFDSFRGFKTWINCQAFPYPEDINIIDVIGDADPNWDPSNYTQGLPMVTNSGANALMLAAVLGASPIYLLGFDMKGTDGHTANYHVGYPDNNNDSVYQEFIPCFQKYAPKILSRSKVINLNPQSELKTFEFGEFSDIKPIRRPVIVSFYTPEYEKEAERFEKSVRRFGFETDIIRIPKRGTWLKTIYWRANFLLEMLEKHRRDIVWIDCDAEMCQYPELFDDFDADFGIHHALWVDREDEYLGGTMYFKYSPQTLEFMKLWIRMNDQFPNEVLSQHVLKKAILKFSKETWKSVGCKLLMRNLPPTYCQIFDLMENAGKPVICHYQASRKYRDG